MFGRGEIVKGFRGLFQGINGQMVQAVPECDEICEFDCSETVCSLGKWETCERRLQRFIRASAENGNASCASPRQPDGNVEIKAGWLAANWRVYGEDFAAVLRESDWILETRKVIVFPGGEASPIQRVEIEIKDPMNVPATADALANALHEWGFTWRAAYESDIPMNEIWLTFPRNVDVPALMSLAISFKPVT
jgi:hypothetical protein